MKAVFGHVGGLHGPLFKLTLAIVQGRLQGEMTGERDGVVLGNAKVDAGKQAKDQ